MKSETGAQMRPTPALNRSSGTIHARATVPNPDRLLTPGVFARVKLVVGTPVPALLVQDTAVLPDQSQHLVMTVAPNRVDEITGPRLLTFAEVAAELSAASGHEVVYLPVTRDEFVAGMVAEGVPADVAGAYGELFGEVLDGRNASITDGVRAGLGRPPRDFATYALAAAATGAWSPSASGR